MNSPTPFPSDTFGKYRLIRELGRGGMGVVYEAMDEELHRRVAVKFLSEGLFPEETQLKMFEREVEALAAIRHPNVVAIYETGRANERRYYAMAYVEGCTLERLMDGLGAASRRGESFTVQEMVTRVKDLPAPPAGDRRVGKSRAVPVNQALNIMAKILSALEQIHNRGLIHRDIKPSNIMIDAQGEPLLMDFGLARAADPRQSQSLTLTGQVMGTPAYMSPEQATGAKGVVNEKSDIYSLGAVFYEMLTGEPPFIPSGNPYADLQHLIDNDPTKIHRLNPAVPGDLETICHKALDKDPERRYRTAGAFLQDLGRYVNGDPVQARPPSLLYRWRKRMLKHKVLSAAALTVACALILLAAVWGWSRRALADKENALRTEKARAEGKWILAYQNDFHSPALDTAHWESVLPALNTLTYGVENGCLVLRKKGRLFSRLPFPGNLKLEFEAAADSGAEISGYLKCDSARVTDNDNFYHFAWAWDGCKWQKGRNGKEVDPGFFCEKNVPNLYGPPGVWHRIRVDCEDGLCRFFADESLYVEARDLFYLEKLGNGHWGFRSVAGVLRIDNLKVFRQVLPERIAVDKILGLHIAANQPDKALDALSNIFLNYEDPKLIAGAVGYLPALDALAPEKRYFQTFFSNAAFLDKIAYCRDSAALYRLLSEALLRLPGRLSPAQFCEAAAKFSLQFPPEQRYQMLVFTALAMEQLGEDSLRGALFRKGREIKNDAHLDPYLTKSVQPAPRRNSGVQQYVPAGYLPLSVGRCAPVNGFYMDSTEVTQELYGDISGKNSSYHPGRGLPAEQVSWYEAILFCNARSKREGLDTCYRLFHLRDTVVEFINPYNKLGDSVRGPVFEVHCDFNKNGYRLPTANELEYAIRADLPFYFPGVSDSSKVLKSAWLGSNAGNHSHPVAQKQANKFGLYDMVGNLWEYCWPDDKTKTVGTLLGRSFSRKAGLGFTQPASHFSGNELFLDGLGWAKNYDQGLRCVRRE